MHPTFNFTLFRLFALWLLASLLGCGGEDVADKVATETLKKAQNEAQDELQELVAKSPPIKILSEQLEKSPNNAELYYRRGTLLVQANAPTQAAFDLDRALQLDSTQANYYLAAADLYFSRENVIKAIRILESAQKRRLENPAITTQLGKYYFYMQQYDQAEAALKTALVQHPKNDQARFWLGCTYRDRQQNDLAIEQLTQAVALNPDLYNAQIMLAQLYAEKKDDKAIAYYEKASALDTTNVEADYSKAMYWQTTGRTAAALKAYRAILLKDNQYTKAYYNIGYIYFEQKNYEQALQNFNIAVRTSPAYADAYYMRGLSAEMLGKKEDAQSDYSKALTFDPKHEKAAKAIDAMVNQKASNN